MEIQLFEFHDQSLDCIVKGNFATKHGEHDAFQNKISLFAQKLLETFSDGVPCQAEIMCLRIVM